MNRPYGHIRMTSWIYMGLAMLERSMCLLLVMLPLPPKWLQMVGFRLQFCEALVAIRVCGGPGWILAGLAFVLAINHVSIVFEAISDRTRSAL